ncbi:glycosyltransferase GlcNAc [Nitzschia inconspicua]|uniref:Glycosyltransferase GlcNAc n=1 Tax=Nitzschia inconspicua TaxID=303405 RepID=A0A9K3PDX2_9STRA|nr:glycosyltransferase GlcNAc [Nitzschia inconspicua]
MAVSSNDDKPYGHCLLARDTPQNRALFPNGPFGNEPVAASICPSGDCPHYSYTEDIKGSHAIHETPIHILVASFRDRLCGRTLHNAFQHADNPHRLYIRVIQQTKPDSGLDDDIGCWDYYCEHYNQNCDIYKHQVRIVPVNAEESKGPTWARSKLSAMVEWDFTHPHDLDFVPVHLQDFCMQIDSHMDFSDHFDTELIDMFHLTKNDYAVLSTYVTDIAENNKDPKNVPNLCMVTFTSSIRNWGTKECTNLKTPKLTNAMWGAGLSFHRCHAEVNVPVDPYLDNVFDGEEGSRGIRFFTHGYDVYTPHRVLVTHDYHGHQSNPVVHTWGHTGGGPVKQESHWKWMDEIDFARSGVSVFGSQRVNLLLGIGPEDPQLLAETELIRNSRYGLGTKRTLEQAIEFTGINLREMKMETNKCGNLEWVPFEESHNYGIDELLSRSRAAESVQPYREAAGAVAAAEDVIEMNVTPQRIRFNASGSGLPVSTTTFDYSLMGGLVCAALALVVRVSTRKRHKNEKHKN